MKIKKIFSICLAVLMMLSVLAFPASAAELDIASDETISATNVEPRNVQRNWTNLSIGTSYKYLDTGNNNKIDNWNGSYATFTFENKSNSYKVTLRITDYDKNGNKQHGYEETIKGDGGSVTVKVTPGGYYMVEAKSGTGVSISGVNLSTYTER